MGGVMVQTSVCVCASVAGHEGEVAEEVDEGPKWRRGSKGTIPKSMAS